MAKTQVSSSDALTKKLWEEKLFRDTVKESYFSRFFGSGVDSLVQVKTDLTKSKGDVINFGILMRLSGNGVTDNEILRGNEERLVTHDASVQLHLYRHAVRDAGAIDRQRAVYDMDESARSSLLNWGAEKIDQLCFDAITSSPTKIVYGGSATSTATITTSDKLTPALISKVKTIAKTGANRSFTPLRPVKVKGKSYFILLVHPDVMYDLKNDSTFAQALREAQIRGDDNPLFSGATAIWDGVVIHEHENIPIVTNWGSGSNVPGAKCVFMGAQSLVWAWGKRPYVTEELIDYENEHGYAWNMIAGVTKPVFNSKDYGSIGVYVARTQISDA